MFWWREQVVRQSLLRMGSNEMILKSGAKGITTKNPTAR